MVSTMSNEVKNIDAGLMEAYEIRTGFIGLGEFLESLGVVKLIRGESCTKK